MRKRHRKRLRKKDIVKRRIIITISLFSLTLILTISYSAFSTNINLSAKGHVYKTSDKCYETSDNEDGTVTITNYDKNCGSEVNIPSTIKGKIVTRIGSTSWDVSKSFNNKDLTKVVIPDTVMSIGACAFWSNNISYLDLGNGVQSIGAEAFVGNKLTSIIFPPSLKELREEAFRNNRLTSVPSLENIRYGGGIFAGNNLTGDDVFIYGKNSDGIIDNTILNSYGGKSAKEITLPSNVKTIQPYAFRQISASTINLTNVENIEIVAFFQTQIPIINISNAIKSINKEAVTQSPNITTININRKENSIAGAPWGATNATVNWTGDN